MLFLEKILSRRQYHPNRKLITSSRGLAVDELKEILEVLGLTVKSAEVIEMYHTKKDWHYLITPLGDDTESATPVDQDYNPGIDQDIVEHRVQGNSKADLDGLWNELNTACAVDTEEDVIVNVRFKDRSLRRIYNDFLTQTFPNSNNVLITTKNLEAGSDSDEPYLRIRLDDELKSFLATFTLDSALVMTTRAPEVADIAVGGSDPTIMSSRINDLFNNTESQTL